MVFNWRIRSSEKVYEKYNVRLTTVIRNHTGSTGQNVNLMVDNPTNTYLVTDLPRMFYPIAITLSLLCTQ